MFGNLVNNLRSRVSVTNKIADISAFGESHSESGGRAQTLFNKLLSSSYSLISQSNLEDSYCNDNMYMLPRVLESPDGNCAPPWSPVALAPKEKHRDELDNVVDKFIRCVSVNGDSLNERSASNVKIQ